jgi:hypothetical protein
MEPELMEYTDDKGLHVMCACGHYASGAIKPGDKIAMCPQCRLLAYFQKIPSVYPQQMPQGTSLK